MAIDIITRTNTSFTSGKTWTERIIYVDMLTCTEPYISSPLSKSEVTKRLEGMLEDEQYPKTKKDIADLLRSWQATIKPKAKKGKKSSAARPDKEHAIKDRSGRTSDDIDPKEYDISSDEMWEE